MKRAEQPFDEVQKPVHYNSHPSGIESIEIKRHLSSDWSDVWKYVFRTELKNGRQDLEKARWYAADAIAFEIPLHAPTWNEFEFEKMDKIIANEPKASRREFYLAVKYGDCKSAALAVMRMLDE